MIHLDAVTPYHGNLVIRLSIRYSNAVLKWLNSLCTGFVHHVVAWELSGFCGYFDCSIAVINSYRVFSTWIFHISRDTSLILSSTVLFLFVYTSIHTLRNSHLIVLFCEITFLLSILYGSQKCSVYLYGLVLLYSNFI